MRYYLVKEDIAVPKSQNKLKGRLFVLFALCMPTDPIRFGAEKEVFIKRRASTSRTGSSINVAGTVMIIDGEHAQC